MSNYPGMPPMVIPPPPPPPPKGMDVDKHGGMMHPMMEAYDDGMGNVAAPVEGYPGVPVVPMVHGFVPQPPPPQVHGVAAMGVPQQMVMAPGVAMQNASYQTADTTKQLIDPYLAAEISSIVHTLSTSQLVYVLAALKKFLKHAPSEARRFLINNPQLTYALLHTQFILGEHDETVLPLSKIDHDISQVNKLERSMHLKPFHQAGTAPAPAPEAYPEGYPQQAPAPEPAQQAPQQDPAVHEAPFQEPLPPAKPEPAAKKASDDATHADIEEIMNQGVYPASAALVDEVLKNPEILTK